MAAVTRRTGNHVRSWLAGSGFTVVATGTGARDITVYNTRRFPGRTGVAVAAGRGAGNMSGRLARGGRAVVTAGTGARDLTVIEICRFPSRRCVTGIASCAGSNVRR